MSIIRAIKEHASAWFLVAGAMLSAGLTFALAGDVVWAGTTSALLVIGGAGLYQRLRGTYVLGNRVRRQILHTILDRPGIGVQELAKHCAVRRQTATYHLNVLSDFGLVDFVKDGLTVRAFPSTVLSDPKRTVQLVLERPWARGVMELLQEAPETSVRRLAQRMGVSRSTARWYVHKLSELGVLRPKDQVGSYVVLPPATDLVLFAAKAA